MSVPRKKVAKGNLTLRLTSELRERLEALSALEGRSLSECAERAIDDGLFWRALVRKIGARDGSNASRDTTNAEWNARYEFKRD